MPSEILRYFAYEHLSPALQERSKPLGDLARQLDAELPDGPEKSAGLRKLLEAKDCFVRAALPSPAPTPPPPPPNPAEALREAFKNAHTSIGLQGMDMIKDLGDKVLAQVSEEVHRKIKEGLPGILGMPPSPAPTPQPHRV